MEKIHLTKREIAEKELEEYRIQVLNKITSDSEFFAILLKLGFNESDIRSFPARFERFYVGHLKNKEYKSIDDCRKNNDFYRFILYKDEHNQLSETRIEYDCFRRFNEYANKFDINDTDIFDICKKTLKSFKNPNIAKKMSYQYQKEKARVFYIYGGSGSGKTYLAQGFLNALAKSKSVESVSYFDLVKRSEHYSTKIFSTDKSDIFNDLKLLSETQVLVIDGFGEEIKLEQLKESFIIPLLKERVTKKNKVTIIVSKYSLDEIQKLYTLKQEGSIIRAKDIVSYIGNNIIEPIYLGKLAI